MDFSEAIKNREEHLFTCSGKVGSSMDIKMNFKTKNWIYLQSYLPLEVESAILSKITSLKNLNSFSWVAKCNYQLCIFKKI